MVFVSLVNVQYWHTTHTYYGLLQTEMMASHCFCLHHPITMSSNSYCKSCNSYRTAAIFIVYPSAVFRVLINGEGVLCDYPKNSCGRHYKFHSVLTFPTHMKTAQMLDLICSYISPTSIFIMIPLVSSF